VTSVIQQQQKKRKADSKAAESLSTEEVKDEDGDDSSSDGIEIITGKEHDRLLARSIAAAEAKINAFPPDSRESSEGASQGYLSEPPYRNPYLSTDDEEEDEEEV
jgi:hypothetical protein